MVPAGGTTVPYKEWEEMRRKSKRLPSGEIFYKLMSAQELLRTIVANVRAHHRDLEVRSIRSAKWRQLPNTGEVAGFVFEGEIGNYWKYEATVWVDDDPAIEDFRDGQVHLSIWRDPLLFGGAKRRFFGRFYHHMLCNNGYLVDAFKEICEEEDEVTALLAVGA